MPLDCQVADLTSHPLILELVSTLSREQLDIQSPDFVVGLAIDFDYNLQAFMPVAPPAILPLGTGGEISNEIRKHLKSLWEVMSTSEKEKGVRQHMVVVMYNNAMTTAQISLAGDGAPPSYTYQDVCDACLKVGKPSPLLDTKDWPTLKVSNMADQLIVVPKGQSYKSFVFFLFGSLRLFSDEPRHKTHIVIVHVELGRGLGEISSLVSAKVVEMEQGFTDLTSHWNGTDEELQDYKKKHFTRGPDKSKNPNDIFLPFFFVNDENHVVVPMGVTTEPPTSPSSMTVEWCDEVAASSFRDLQAVDLPPIKSPPLAW